MPTDKDRMNSVEPINSEKLLNKAKPSLEPGGFMMGGLWGLMKRMTLKTFVALLMSVSVYTSSFFVFGYLVAMSTTGITLNLPFDMRISVTEKVKSKIENGKTHFILHNLSLIKMPHTHTRMGEKKCLWIYRHVEDTYDKEVGQVECLVPEASISDFIKDRLFGQMHSILGDTAFAQSFSLGPHKNDNNYKQSFVPPNTIRRTYNDGCVLEFKVDAKGESIPGSYAWIIYKH